MSDPQKLRNALWLLMQHDIFRYLISNAKGRENGAMKAEHHLRLSKIMVAVYLGEDHVDQDYFADTKWETVKKVHDATQAMTNHLDRIGFDLQSTHPDYDSAAPKFFEVFIRLGEEVLLKKEGQSIAAWDVVPSAERLLMSLPPEQRKAIAKRLMEVRDDNE